MKELYIYSISSITNQDSFENPGFSENIGTFSENKELIQPDYKACIPAIKLRRMPRLSRMAIATSLSTLEQAQMENVGAIIVGTGLGSIDDTERFLQKYIAAGESLVPPVSFIQSGHNTVSGQIALFLANHCYNMTHVQQHLSFEHALIDSKMYAEENDVAVLLGAFDEKIPLLTELANYYRLDDSTKDSISEGCTFMIVGNDSKKGLARIVDIETQVSDLPVVEKVTNFLTKNNTSLKEIDQLLIGSNLYFDYRELKASNAIVYTDYCGQYFTSAAFACHLGVDMITNYTSKKVLVLNGMADKLGITLLSNV